jgi:Uma2 family endonuclease
VAISAPAAGFVTRDPDYPESDGQPMADNTRQFEWIVTIEGGLDALFRDDPDVFVAGDLLWYPVEGRVDLRAAPDAMVVFGRPKGHRGSYIQHREAGIAPQVVFEVLSPNNRLMEMVRQLRFYERYGVEEYYVYDPETGDLAGWLREGEELHEIPEMRGWVSPRLGVTFELDGTDLCLTGPDSRRFASYVELTKQRNEALRERDQAQEQARRLAERLRELGVDPDAV